MRFAEILKLAAWTESESCLRRHYCKDELDVDDPDEFVLAHEHVYLTLHELLPQPNHTMIVIDAHEEDGVEDVDVYGIKPGFDDAWSLAFTRWERWLGMEIAPSTLQRFSPSEILAHCLYEMSFYGYNQEEIQGRLKEVEGRAEVAMNADRSAGRVSDSRDDHG